MVHKKMNSIFWIAFLMAALDDLERSELSSTRAAIRIFGKSFKIFAFFLTGALLKVNDPEVSGVGEATFDVVDRHQNLAKLAHFGHLLSRI